MTRAMITSLLTVLMVCLGFANPGWADESLLSLHQAVTNATSNDPWLKGSELNEQALLAESIAVGELPDPRLSVGLANLATDTLEFDQEPMTQLKVGIAQVFPRGESRKLQRQQKQQESAAYPLLREDRKAQVALKVSLLWLDNFLAQQSIVLIERNHHLFEQLVDITHANYIATSGSTRQQDVIRAELELTGLNDRLIGLRQQGDAAKQSLLEWLSPELANKTFPGNLPDISTKTWPEKSINTDLSSSTYSDTPQALARIIQQHPRLQVIDRKLRVVATSVDLAKEQYKPEWGINAAYSYRDDDPLGNDRADFMSFGITVDLPLFTENRQDQRVAAATHRRAALQTEHDLAFREFVAAYKKTRVELQRLDEREQLYQQHLLPQMHDQADAALAAYTSDGGDFAEVMRARIAELNTKIMALELKVKRHKMVVNMNYFTVGMARSMAGGTAVGEVLANRETESQL